MFQTDVNHFLQHINNPVWTCFMEGISALGSYHFYLLFLFALIFSIEYRKGFIVLQCMLWSNFFTVWLKDILNMPRPYHVDAELRIFENLQGVPRLKNGGAVSFFSTLPQYTLEQLRNSGEISNGFPSGHTSTATSFWISAGVLLRKKGVLISAVVFVLLTIVSRLFLAQHFLADIVGGLFIGIIPVFIVFYGVIRRNVLENWLAFKFWQNKTSLFFWIAPLLLLLLPDTQVSLVGTIIGVNAGAWLACRNGFPSSEGSFWKRMVRFFVSIIVFSLINLFFGKLTLQLTNDGILFSKNVIEFGLVFYLSTRLCLHLKLFENRLTDAQPMP